MGSEFSRRWRFFLERWVQRGVVHQLLLMASLVVAVAAAGGVAAWALTPAFDELPTAVWWAFLRLTDPGYLGDDEGTALRVVSTVVTVLGYVLFMGSMIAIMTQWLAGTVRKLESGLTPISMQGHFVILGWTNRTPEIIRKLMTAGGRLERFFERRGGSSRLRVVVLADEVDAGRRQELRDILGSDWDEGNIFLRSGSSLRREHLDRLDLLRSAVVVIPGADFELGGAELTDTRVVKTLLTLDTLFRSAPEAPTPHVVAELFDPRKVSIASSSIRARTNVIAGDRLISRLLSQSLRHPGVAAVLLRLLTHREGNAVYLRSFPELAGSSTRGIHRHFPEALVLGAVSVEGDTPRVRMDPEQGATLQADDLLILVAERYEKCRCVQVEADEELLPEARPIPIGSQVEMERLLILGWTYKIPTLLAELLESGSGSFEVTIMSRVTAVERQRTLSHLEVGDRLRIEHVEGDYSLEHDLQGVDPAAFDHVLFLASAWMESSSEADARTVLGVVLLRSLLRRREGRAPEILVELLDPESARILDQELEAVFVSPRVLSHVLAHVALRPELHAVFEELTGALGAEIDLLPPESFGLAHGEVTFPDVQLAAATFGCIALGFLVPCQGAAPEVHLNPDRERRWALAQQDRIVVLKNQESA